VGVYKASYELAETKDPDNTGIVGVKTLVAVLVLTT
jgi:hypothetical protein